ncbi:hypothetical protein NECAME_04899 [Necator americanus]|uniref:Uncharacterized protein n=1 Tax=Necator americanus TaxID=51031 RepID=W2SNN0_NECAM|nr:hypothetical protein NECAME_04899 [Necator americanus]ETN70476.1 hypothetical protein NECAME_04899 [Necator americanus]
MQLLQCTGLHSCSVYFSTGNTNIRDSYKQIIEQPEPNNADEFEQIIKNIRHRTVEKEQTYERLQINT